MSSTFRGSLSTVPQGQIIDFETAELRRLPFQNSLFLWVKGDLPASGFFPPRCSQRPRRYI